MTPEQWRQAWEIFQAAQDLPEPDRTAFISGRSADPAVLAKVAALFDDLKESDEESVSVQPERAAGDHVGRYVIEQRIGRGSYGEVWSGRDIELRRRVGLKFIAPERQGDENSTRRFLREARAASALNHPNIVVVHEVISSDSGPVIVMELVEGQALRSIMNHPVPESRAIGIASQILKALSFAHAAGLTHRDLKPENIMLRPDGFVKVLDFGLARNAIDISASQSASAGLSVGTLRYMAPEQCQGKAATPASDIFAVGVILYELLTGTHPFEAPSWIETVHSVVHREAKPVPGPTGALVDRMLQKDPAGRPSAEEAAAILERNPHPAVPPPSAQRLSKWWALATAALALGWLAFEFRGPSHDPNLRLTDTRLELGDAIGIDTSQFALSPDGRNLVFASGRAGKTLYVLDLAHAPAKPWQGVEGSYPFWSPDGKEVGFASGGKLWRKAFPDGPAREICEAPKISAAHWGPNGVILFASSATDPILKVHQDGSIPVPITRFEGGDRRHDAPFVLPDGKHFVYWSAVNRRIGRLLLADIEGKEPQRELARSSSSAIYVPRPSSSVGALVFRAGPGLMLLPFDSSSNQVVGQARTISERVNRDTHNFVPGSASARGDLIYRVMEDRRTQAKIFDRKGVLQSKVGALKEYIAASPSPDFRWLALLSENYGSGQRDFELYDFKTGQTTPVPQAIASSDPTWAPSSKDLLAGNSSVSGGIDLYRISLPETGPPLVKLVPGPRNSSWPSHWSADGKQAILTFFDPITNFDIWVLPMDGREKPRPLITSPAREQRASLSPDGKLLLYMSDESKTAEIYVTPYPPDGRKWKVSTGGGAEPRWRGDGKELFYISPDFALMSVNIGGGPSQPSFSLPTVLFGGLNADPALFVQHCEPFPDGRRFAILTGTAQQSAEPLRLRQNWWAENP